jgi:hypothetical protein
VLEDVCNSVVSSSVVSSVRYSLGELCIVSKGSSGIELVSEDIVVSRVSGSIGSLGKSWVVGSKGLDSWPGNPESCIHIRVVRRDILLPGYLYYLLKYLHSVGYFRKLARGSVQQFIRVSDVSGIALGVSL